MIDSVGPALVIGIDSQPWRRRLGPLAWAALEHLALAAHPDHHGWAAPLGVRDIAAGIGVTKDTAARAVSTLAAAELVTRARVDTAAGPRRSGYLLHLPVSMRLVDCPEKLDEHQGRPTRRPEGEYINPAADRRCIPPEDTGASGPSRGAGTAPASTSRPSWDQLVLVDTARPDETLATHASMGGGSR